MPFHDYTWACILTKLQSRSAIIKTISHHQLVTYEINGFCHFLTSIGAHITHISTKNRQIPLQHLVIFVCFSPCLCVALFKTESHLTRYKLAFMSSSYQNWGKMC